MGAISEQIEEEGIFNLFFPNAPFLYHPKTLENRKVFECLQGVEKGFIGSKWVNFAWICLLPYCCSVNMYNLNSVQINDFLRQYIKYEVIYMML